MDPKDIGLIRRCLPEMTVFPYYPDRESAWGLAQMMPGDAPVSALKHGPVAKLLTRPLLRPLVAAGGGRLAQRDVLALAHADRAMGWSGLGRAAQEVLGQVYARPWLDFQLTLTQWGTGRYWQDNQISRKGGNLVLQLGFPSDHAQLMGRYMAPRSRKDFEYARHPIRRDGRPTLAWARLDIDLESGTALIEEIQSDWLRFVREEVEALQDRTPRSRELTRARAYEAGLRARYEKLWPRAMMLAALHLLRDELGCRDIYMHMPLTGAALKHIRWTLPPRSLYTALPKWFGFLPVAEAPAFLRRPRRRALSLLARAETPLFWRLTL